MKRLVLFELRHAAPRPDHPFETAAEVPASEPGEAR